MVDWFKKHKNTIYMTFWFSFTLYWMVQVVLNILAGIILLALLHTLWVATDMALTIFYAKKVYAEQET